MTEGQQEAGPGRGPLFQEKKTDLVRNSLFVERRDSKEGRCHPVLQNQLKREGRKGGISSTLRPDNERAQNSLRAFPPSLLLPGNGMGSQLRGQTFKKTYPMIVYLFLLKKGERWDRKIATQSRPFLLPSSSSQLSLLPLSHLALFIPSPQNTQKTEQ